MAQLDSSAAAWAAYRGKSVWVVHMLRHVLQRDGAPTALAALIDELVSEFQTKPISTFDFKKIAEKHAGKSLDWFFDNWVFGTGVPAYSLDFKVETATGGFAITGKITQSGVPDSFEMPVPLYADDRFLGNVTVSDSGGEFRFVTRTRPQQVLLDPQKTILSRE
jgi:aminopeptidase N